MEYQDMYFSQGFIDWSHKPTFVLQWNFYSNSTFLVYKAKMDLTAANSYHDTHNCYTSDKNY